MKAKQKQMNKRQWGRIALISFIFMCVSIFGSGEDCYKEDGSLVITYDFLDPTKLCNCPLEAEYGKNILLKVVNVNPFLYKVTINAEPFNYFSEAPKEFSLIPEEKTESDTAILMKTQANNLNAQINNLETQIEKKSKTLGETTEALKKTNKTLKETKKALSIDDLKKKQEKANVEIEKLNKDISKLNSQVRELTDDREKTNALDAFNKGYYKLSKITEFYNCSRRLAMRSKKLIDLKSDITSLMNLLWSTDKPGIDDAYRTFNNWYAGAEIKYEAIDLKWLEAKGCSDPEFKQIAKQLDTYKKNLDKMKNDKVIDSIDDLLSKLTDQNFERSLLVTDVDADEIHFTVKIESLDKEKSVILNEVPNSIKVKVKGGWTINFSTGLFVNVDPFAHIYRLEEVQNQPGKVSITEGSETTIKPAAAVFMHAYPRWAGRSGWGGFSLGIGSKDANKLNYYFGSSWMIGRKQRFIMNLGAALAPRNVLKSEYKLGQELQQDENLKVENLVNEKYRFSFFFGISYNLTKSKTESASKTQSK